MKINAKTKGFILSIIFILLCNGAGFCENESRSVFASYFLGFETFEGLEFSQDFQEEGLKNVKQENHNIESVTEWAKGSPSALLGETVLKIYGSNSRIAGTQKQKLTMDTGVAIRKNICKIFFESSYLVSFGKVYTEYKVANYIHKLDGKKKANFFGI